MRTSLPVQLALLLALLAGCKPTPKSESTAQPTTGAVSVANAPELWSAAQEVLDKRCVVCHGCYDSPCQLQLGSYDGIARGASQQPVYEGSRLKAIEPTRLFVDAHSVPDWRDKGFHPVLQEGDQKDPRKSLIARMLQLKRTHPLPQTEQLSSKDFDLSLDREQVCTEEDDFDDFAEDHPMWGMPYALPAVSESEHAALMAWVEAGAPHVQEEPLSAAHEAAIQTWETFLNEPSKKGKLYARYIYEHLFLASIFFQDVDESTFFRVVRSRTPPGSLVDEIPTRRPFEDPQTKQLYYRIVRRHGKPLVKTHMPYALSNARLARWKELFVDAKYEVTDVPTYDPGVAANPFKAFRQLPVRSRYRFMLEEAEFTMMGFIKGPVCRGQIALNVIEDRFWITFVNPDASWIEAEAKFLEAEVEELDMPAQSGSNSVALGWFRLARKQRRFLEAKSKFLDKIASQGVPVDLGGIWDGDGYNANAALTVLRHFDSATVVKGFVGGPSKTSWVVGYALLERIHYLLVAGFDVFGNIGHQLTTRMYMDFLRMEGEHNYLLLLPEKRRKELVDQWYRDVSDDVKDEVYGQTASFKHPSAIPYKTQKPELELAKLLEEHTQKARAQQHELTEIKDQAVQAAFDQLSKLVGVAAAQFPEISFVAVEGRNGRMHHGSILRDSSHTNVAHLFREEKRRVPTEDRLTVTNGFLGAYPDALFLVAREELSAFVTQAETIKDEADYLKLRARFGVLRTHPAFWSHADRLHDDAHKLDPLRVGLFDFNRLDGE